LLPNSTPQLQHLLRTPQLHQPIERGPNGIKGIPPAKRLRNHVTGTNQLHHSPYRTARDNPRSLNGRFQEHMLSAEQPMNLMGNRPGLERHMDQVLLGLLDSLRNGNGHLGGFALSDADPPLSISHNHQGTKVKPLPALHNLGNAVDEHDLIFQAEFVRVNSHAISLLLVWSSVSSLDDLDSLELEPSFAGCISQGFDTPVKETSSSIENHRLNFGGLGSFGQQLADSFRRHDAAG
jgi:hypothetical protein